jgi:hypothetical protein
VYPDAKFVMTHRDLGAVLPSVCAVKEALSTPVVAQLDLHALGRHEVDIWSESLRRLIEFRDAGREDRFFDVMFADVQADPVAAMERLYAELGDELTDDTRVRMADWWAEEAASRRPGPRPDPKAYGLDVATLREQFAFYHDRFDIPVAG